MKQAVREAIAELEEAGLGEGVRFEEDDDGGAYVAVDGVEIGECFSPSLSWIGFHITHSYPEAAVYPHFVDPALRYVGHGATVGEQPEDYLPTSITRGDFKLGELEPVAIRVSRSSPKRAPGTDTALKKLERVIAFLESR